MRVSVRRRTIVSREMFGALCARDRFLIGEEDPGAQAIARLDLEPDLAECLLRRQEDAQFPWLGIVAVDSNCCDLAASLSGDRLDRERVRL